MTPITANIAVVDNEELIRYALIFGKKRANRPIDQTRGQDFLVGRLAFATEVTARDTAGRRELLTVVDGQGEEVLVRRA